MESTHGETGSIQSSSEAALSSSPLGEEQELPRGKLWQSGRKSTD